VGSCAAWFPQQGLTPWLRQDPGLDPVAVLLIRLAKTSWAPIKTCEGCIKRMPSDLLKVSRILVLCPCGQSQSKKEEHAQTSGKMVNTKTCHLVWHGTVLGPWILQSIIMLSIKV